MTATQEPFASTPSELITISRQQDANLTRWQLTPEDILMEIEHDLRGEYFDHDTEKFTKPEGSKEIMSELGIRRTVSVLRAKINKITFLSNLDEEIVREITLDVNLSLISLFFSHYEAFNLDVADMEIIIDKVVHLVYIGLMRAFEEGERRFLGKAEKRMEITKLQPEKESGFASIFKRK